MKRVLIINTIGFGYEGISSVIINYIENMNREGLEFYFAAFENTGVRIKKKLETLGRVIEVPFRKKNVCKYMVSLNRLLKSRFDIVHIHGNSGTMAIETCLCKLNKIKKTLIHCHSTHTNYPMVNQLLKGIAIRQADICLACSKAAGEFLYGKNKYIVLNNAIQIKKYKFNEEIRRKYRKQFGITQEILVGHIGYFSKVKNHEFLIDAFKEYYERNHNSKLLLVSDGILQHEIKKKAESLGLKKVVIFAGRRSDVECLYQAMDIFVLPSLWEGLPLVTIEAQAAGLPVLVSENVTEAAGCTEQFYVMNLDSGAKRWAEKMEGILDEKSKIERIDTKIQKDIRDKGFDISKEASKLRCIYVDE